jgi:Fe-S-cluster formation regulator IscX/YfhJ
MSWVWERFRNTFRSSSDDDVEDVDIDTVRFLEITKKILNNKPVFQDCQRRVDRLIDSGDEDISR